MAKIRANCISCALKPFMRFSSFIGIPCISISCFHSKTKNAAIVSFSKVYLLTTVLISCVLISLCLYYLIKILAALANNIKILLVVPYAINLCFCLRSTITVVFCLIQTKLILATFRGLDLMIRQWKLVKAEILLDVNATNNIRKQSYYFVAFTCFFILFYGTYLCFTEFSITLAFLLKFLNCLCFYIDLMILSAYVAVNELFITVFIKYQRILKVHMLDNLEKTNSVKRYSIRKSLVLARRLHSAHMWNVKYFNYYTDPVTLVWLLTATAIIVASFFIMLTSWIDPNSGLSTVTGLEVQIYVSLLVIIYLLTKLEDLQAVVSLI